MFKTIALIGFGAAIALAPAAALAQYPSGYGVRPGHPAQSQTTFDRSWNHFNQSKEEARAGARYMRRHYFSHEYPRY
jgi:hypothetical protein